MMKRARVVCVLVVLVGALGHVASAATSMVVLNVEGMTCGS